MRRWAIGWCVVALLAACFSVRGQNTVTLAWDRSASTNVIGYKVYYGARTGTYTNSADMGNALSGSISNLTSGSTYYFAATAYDAARVESEFSNEVSWGGNTRPMISQIANQTINVNQSAGPLPFTISDGQTPASDLRVTGRSSNTTLVPTSGITFSGTGTNRTVTVKPASGQVGTATITVSVSDGVLSTSTSFSLKVNPLPTVALTAPAAGASFRAPADITLTASVVTNGNMINAVRFYGGTTLLGSDSSPPYTFTWKGVAAGSYNLSAKVVYNGGNIASSAQKGITVTNLGIQLAPSAATLTSPFQLSSGFINQTVNSGVSDGGRAVYSFMVPSGTNYVIYADVLAPSSTANSFFVNIDAEPKDPVMLWDIPTASTPTNRRVTWRGGGTDSSNQYAPKVFSIPAGAHQLIVRGREANTKLGSLTLSPVSGLVAPWRIVTIGTSVTPGIGRISGGEHSLMGAGTISGSGDRFSFLYQTLSGDGEIQGRFQAMDATHLNSRAGFMIRESVTAGAKYVFLGKGGDGSVRWQKRETTSGGASSVQTSSGNLWFKILRRGHKFTGYTSRDGSSWSTFGVSTNVMATNIYIGLAFASGVTNTLRSGDFSDIRVIP